MLLPPRAPHKKLGVSKKTEKPIKPRKSKKNNRKNRTEKKNRLKFWKNRQIWFGFISKKPKKPNRNRKKNRAKTEKTEPKPEKPSQTGLNRFFPKKPNRTETGRFDPVSVFFFFKKIISVWLFFLIKTELNWKWSPLQETN